MEGFYDFTIKRLDGTPESLSRYRGHVVLVMNVASKCGHTPQYEGLEALWRRYRRAGLVVLGFPCNQFGAQEPGSAQEIASFCSVNYDVTFPLFEKIEVNGPGAHPLFSFLKSAAPEGGGGDIEWNFAKFLVSRSGRVAHRFAPSVEPQDLATPVASLLGT